MAKKGEMPNFETTDDYIASQPENVQKALKELRAIIKSAVPEAEERLNYKIPCFNLIKDAKRDQQIMIAGYAKFVGFYPFPSTIKAFEDELSTYKKGKGSVQFPLDQALPKDLIIRMVKYRKEELLKGVK